MSVVSSKGQVTIPKEFREKMGLSSGSEVKFEMENGKLVVKKEKTDFGDYKGYLGDKNTDEFMDVIRCRE